MFPSLSNRTKSLIAIVAVLIVAVCNVMFGMDWATERPAVRPIAAVTGVSEPPAVASPPVQSPPIQTVIPAPPAAATRPPINRNTAVPPKISASQPDTAITIMNEPAVPAAEAAPPKCDVAACAAAYHSFTASDCTYMPNAGVRRLCTKGTPPQ